MDSDTKFILLVIGLPIAGLIYCGIGVALMLNSATVRTHPLFSGLFFILLPLSIYGLVWLKASLKS